MYKSMFRPEVIRRVELCFFRPCAKLPSLPRTSEIHHVVTSAERLTSVYINLVRCVCHCFTFSLVLGVSPIAIVVCLINILTFTFSRLFYPKRLTMYTHFTFTLMAHCTSGAIRGSVSCSRTLRQGIELATF